MTTFSSSVSRVVGRNGNCGTYRGGDLRDRQSGLELGTERVNLFRYHHHIARAEFRTLDPAAKHAAGPTDNRAIRPNHEYALRICHRVRTTCLFQVPAGIFPRLVCDPGGVIHRTIDHDHAWALGNVDGVSRPDL